jgi:hypothetical protein
VYGSAVGINHQPLADELGAYWEEPSASTCSVVKGQRRAGKDDIDDMFAYTNARQPVDRCDGAASKLPHE